MEPRIKICGITNREDAEKAVEYGADALGFVFYTNSPRFITPQEVVMLTTSIPVFVSKVGVFVDLGIEEVRKIANEVGLEAIQLHGNESREYCKGFYQPVIKAFRMKNIETLIEMRDYEVSAFLLDAFSSNSLGGTGKKFNWDWALRAKVYNRPIILSGGLTPDNVGEAVRTVHPYAIDVSSGVESVPGKKDHIMMRDFIQACKKV
ncbi:MAG: phosphoribosylanthranilate isomerase [Verrucomicrobiota bacterium]|nr:phosphoribosylanthranilate isomerase [Verrucomicrobiota bacterium]